MNQTAMSSLRSELARTIAEHRGGWKAGHTADDILDRDRVSTYLVGLYEDAEYVIFYDHTRNAVIGYPFADNSLNGGERTVLERVSQREKLHNWIAEQNFEQWTWLHPRYRWIYGFTESDSDSHVRLNSS